MKGLMDALKKVQNQDKKTTGKAIEWYILNGNDVYKKIFYELAKRIQNTPNERIYLTKSELYRHCRIPSSVAAYPIYKYVDEGLIDVNKDIIFINKSHLKKWSELCSTLQAT